MIKRQGTGARETFTVRKQSFGVGVERTFPLHSPKIEKIEVASRGDVRRAKLYYLRERVGRGARVRERRWTGAADEQAYVEGAMPADDAPRPGEEELAEATAAEEAAAAAAEAAPRAARREEAPAAEAAPAGRGRRPRRPPPRRLPPRSAARPPRRRRRGCRRGSRRRAQPPTSRTTSRRAKCPCGSSRGARGRPSRRAPAARSSSWSRSSPSRSAWRSASRPSSSSPSASRASRWSRRSRSGSACSSTGSQALHRLRPRRRARVQAAGGRRHDLLRRPALRDERLSDADQGALGHQLHQAGGRRGRRPDQGARRRRLPQRQAPEGALRPPQLARATSATCPTRSRSRRATTS